VPEELPPSVVAGASPAQRDLSDRGFGARFQAPSAAALIHLPLTIFEFIKSVYTGLAGNLTFWLQGVGIPVRGAALAHAGILAHGSV
jgi:hypothetical protein